MALYCFSPIFDTLCKLEGLFYRQVMACIFNEAKGGLGEMLVEVLGVFRGGEGIIAAHIDMGGNIYRMYAIKTVEGMGGLPIGISGLGGDTTFYIFDEMTDSIGATLMTGQSTKSDGLLRLGGFGGQGKDRGVDPEPSTRTDQNKGLKGVLRGDFKGNRPTHGMSYQNRVWTELRDDVLGHLGNG